MTDDGDVVSSADRARRVADFPAERALAIVLLAMLLVTMLIARAP